MQKVGLKVFPKNTFHQVEKLLTNYGFCHKLCFLSDCRSMLFKFCIILEEIFLQQVLFWTVIWENWDFRFSSAILCFSGATIYLAVFCKNDVSSKIVPIYFLPYFARNWRKLCHCNINHSRKISRELGVNLFRQRANHQCQEMLLSICFSSCFWTNWNHILIAFCHTGPAQQLL